MTPRPKSSLPRLLARVLLLLAGLAIAASPLPARAGGFNLAWGDCGTNGSASRNFACGANVGNNQLYVSVVPDAPIPQFVAMTAQVSIYTPQSTLSPWWHLENPGGCRPRAISSNFNFTAGPFSCSDPWGGSALGGLSWQYWGLEPGARARLRVVCAVATAVSLSAGTEYYMCSFSLDNSASSGPSACAGCADPACLVLDSVSLSPAGGLDAVNVIEPLLRQRVTWQAAADASGLGCAAGSAPKQSTWGGLKSLYH